MKKTNELAKNLDRFQSLLRRAEAEFEDDFFFEKQKLFTDFLGFSWPTVRKWVNDYPTLDNPHNLRRGGQGSRYEFNPRRTLRALVVLATQQSESLISDNVEIRRKIGVDLPDTERAATLDETKSLINMTLTVEAAAKEQGKYTPTEEMIAFLEGYNEAVVSGILGVKTKTDPNGKLPPNVRAEMDGYLRKVTADVHEKAGKFIEEQRARLQQARIGREGVSALNAPILPLTG